jgi:hypothetical protein
VAALLPATVFALPPGQAEPKPFVTSLTLDALFTRGNADKGELGTKIETEGATDYFEAIRGSAAYAYGVSEVDSVESTTAKRWSLNGNVRRPWEPNRTYTFVDAKAESDAVAELNYRVAEGGGAGVYLRKAVKETWTADAGLSWVFEETEDGSDNYPALRLSERYEKEWESGMKAIQNMELLPHAQQVDDFIFIADAALETVITKLLRLRVSTEYHFQNRPPDEAKSYDLRMVLGITAKF